MGSWTPWFPPEEWPVPTLAQIADRARLDCWTVTIEPKPEAWPSPITAARLEAAAWRAWWRRGVRG